MSAKGLKGGPFAAALDAPRLAYNNVLQARHSKALPEHPRPGRRARPKLRRRALDGLRRLET